MAGAHLLEPAPGGWRCRVCQWTWARQPRSECPGVPRYRRTMVPPTLQNKQQLRAAGLQPGGPVHGCYYSGHTGKWCWLYAVSEAGPRPHLTAAQQAQQDRTWAGLQIARVARQVRTGPTEED